jgi:hypothetical protein
MSKPDIDVKERRIVNMQFRAKESEEAEGLGTIEMYAVKYNSQSVNLGDFFEIVLPGAFTEALTKSDVRALVNHDANLILARTASGTLQLADDDTGLKATFDLPDTTYSRDLKVSLQRGDISQCSFAFTVEKSEWKWIEPQDGNPGFWFRKIVKVNEIYDVSIVTYPAYPETEAALRSRPNQKNDSPPLLEEDDDQDWINFITACRSAQTIQ